MHYTDFLAKQKIDAFLTADENTMWYFTRFKSSFGYALLTPSETFLLTDARYAEGAKKQTEGEVTVLTVNGQTLYPTLENLLKNAKRVGFQAERTTVQDYQDLQSLRKEFVAVDNGVYALSMVKTEKELSYIKRACEIAEGAYQKILPQITAGITERGLAAKLDYEMQMLGAEGTSFSTIVAFGENSAVPHHVPGERTLKENEPVLMDFGALYQGYASDITRTVFYGTPNEKFRFAYNAVLGAHTLVAKTLKNGMGGKEADAIARNFLQAQGLGEAFTHSLGHGIGVNIHEYPRLTPTSTETLSDGMVFSNEPGVYFAGEFGIRIENTAYLKKGVYHTFMKTDLTLTVITPQADK